MQYVKKDITTLEGGVIIAHGVNCQNVMGGGVAKALYTKWPKVKEEYHKHCDVTPENLRLGDVVYASAAASDAPRCGSPLIANCFTQLNYGYAQRKYADVGAIKRCLSVVACDSWRACVNSQVHIPRIGAGLGGLDWEKDVVPILEEIEQDTGVEFVVCDL